MSCLATVLGLVLGSDRIVERIQRRGIWCAEWKISVGIIYINFGLKFLAGVQ